MALFRSKSKNTRISIYEIIGVLQSLPDYVSNSKNKDYIQTAAIDVSNFLASKGVNVEQREKTRNQAMNIH